MAIGNGQLAKLLVNYTALIKVRPFLEAIRQEGFKKVGPLHYLRMKEIQDHYKLIEEKDRLSSGIGLLEKERTQEIINRYIGKKNAVILDIGELLELLTSIENESFSLVLTQHYLVIGQVN